MAGPVTIQLRITDKKVEIVKEETNFSDGRFELTTTIRTTGRIEVVSGNKSKRGPLGVAIGKRRV
jgi:hypothetical protein